MNGLWPVLLTAFVAACACLPASQIHERAFWRQRDWALLGLVGLGGIAAARMGDYWLCAIALWALVRWRSTAVLPSVVVWTAIAALWIAATTILPPHRALAGAALTAVAFGQCGCAAWQWITERKRPAVRAPRGTFGQRTLLAAFLSMAVFLVPAWGLAVPLTVGLLLTSSWVAWGAALAGLIVLTPTVGIPATILVCAIVAAAAIGRLDRVKRLVDHGTIRGTSLDSLAQRWRTWALTLRMWPTSPERFVLGSGPGELQYDLLRWDTRFKAELINGYAHCEPLQLVYEYGLCGAAAIALFAWRVGAGLRWGDPWSAAAVAGAVAACGTSTCRTPATGVPWLVVCAIVAGRAG